MWGDKYILRYCDKHGAEYQLAIQERDYLDPEKKIKGAQSPVLISLENSNEIKSGGPCPTVSAINLVSSKDFRLHELYTTDEQKYRVENRRTDGNRDKYWVGFIAPTGFSEEADNNVHDMQILATDRLSSLQGEKFQDENGTNFGVLDGVFMRSYIWILAQILKKTGLDLPIYTMCDIMPLLSGVPEQGGIFSNEIAATQDVESGRNILFMWDTDERIGRSLFVGAKISISGGYNDGKTFTVLDWDWAGEGAQKRLAIAILEPPVDTDRMLQSATLTVEQTPGSTGSYSDPLAISHVDVRSFIDPSRSVLKSPINGKPVNLFKNYYEYDGGVMMCWDVLTSIASLWNVRIIQNRGRWEIRRVNAEAKPAGSYEWFVYNPAGEFTGREPFGEDISFECYPTEVEFMPFGHTAQMDRVLKRVGVQYQFRFKQDGDTFANLIADGNFSRLNTTDNAWREMWDTKAWPAGQYSQASSGLPEGYTTGLILKNELPDPSYVGGRSLVNQVGDFKIEVTQGDKLRLTFFEKLDKLSENAAGVYGITMYPSIQVNIDIGYGPSTDVFRHELVNDGQPRTETAAGGPVNYILDGKWNPAAGPERLTDKYRFFTPFTKSVSNAYGDWRKVIIDLPEVPVSGTIRVEIVGIATLVPKSQDKLFEPGKIKGRIPNYPPPGTVNPNRNPVDFVDGELWLIVVPTGRPTIPELNVTGMFLERHRTGESAEIESIGYLAQQTGNYTDTVNDINIINSDEPNEDFVGNIRVLSDGDLVPCTTWDSWAADFGFDRLGVILAKSVLAMYTNPTVKVDGSYVHPDIDLVSRLSIPQLPGRKFMILRGTLDVKASMITGTIAEVANFGLPDDGGKDPAWEPNGVTRCVKDIETGLNTGFVEVMEVDVNKRSNTYLQVRWTEIEGEDVDMCPVGEPILLYWGAVTEGELPDVDGLLYFPYDKDGDSYRVEYSNDGTGKYLMVYFLASLGELRSVLEIELEESITSWEPMDDVVINGLTYKGYRMWYVTGTFAGHPKTFKIN